MVLFFLSFLDKLNLLKAPKGQAVLVIHPLILLIMLMFDGWLSQWSTRCCIYLQIIFIMTQQICDCYANLLTFFSEELLLSRQLAEVAGVISITVVCVTWTDLFFFPSSFCFVVLQSMYDLSILLEPLLHFLSLTFLWDLLNNGNYFVCCFTKLPVKINYSIELNLLEIFSSEYICKISFVINFKKFNEIYLCLYS